MANVRSTPRGWQGAVLKVLRAKDYRLTVVENAAITDHYRRLVVEDGGLLAGTPEHPTMWVRLWIPGSRTGHQRGYTVVDPDPGAGRFALEFAMHDGPACAWAAAARPGDTIDATVMGTAFSLPSPPPERFLLVGDPASIPAINSLLDSIGDVPALVYLSHQHDSDRDIPLRTGANTTVRWLPRTDGPDDLVRAVADEASQEPWSQGGLFGWAACDTIATRRLTALFRDRLGLAKDHHKTQAYWMAGRRGTRHTEPIGSGDDTPADAPSATGDPEG